MGEIRIKYITCGSCEESNKQIEHNGCVFICDPACRDYDWFVLYDDMPRQNVGSILHEVEKLACPATHTILITQEPPTIKLYPGCFTRQFAYVLTTHLSDTLVHPHAQLSCGAFHPQNNRSWEENKAMPIYEKRELISTVCSAKKMRHTEHFARYEFTRYVSEYIPELHWFGRGVKPLENKYEALDSYKYHIAVENYIHPYHWTDKIIDPILSHCLTFYAGDPQLGNYLPEGSFIPIPLHNPAEALLMIHNAIAANEYEKRLPAILEARRLLIDKYNLYQRVTDIIRHHVEGITPPAEESYLRGRHALRCNPLHLYEEIMGRLCYKWKSLCFVRDEDILG